MRILITSTGFIGARLALMARSKGHEIRLTGLVNTPAEAARREAKAAGIEVLVQPLEPPVPAALVAGVDAIIHLAAVQHEMNVPDEPLRENQLARGSGAVRHGAGRERRGLPAAEEARYGVPGRPDPCAAGRVGSGTTAPTQVCMVDHDGCLWNDMVEVVPPRRSLNEMLSIVIPAYNEEDNVRPLYDAVMNAAARLDREFEVIVVDDGSSDATFERLARLAAGDPRLVVIKLRRNYGQTPALAAGIDHALGDIVVTMDADLQNDPDDIDRLVDALDDGYDLVVGWRRRRQDAWLRSWLSRITNKLIARVTGVRVQDNGCTLKAFRAELIKSLPLYSEMHRFLPALMSIHGCRLLELPVNHRPRQHGNSKYGFSRIYKVFFDLMTIKALLVFARRPLLCFFGSTAITTFAALLSGSAALYHAFMNDGGSAVIFMALSVLLGSLAIFLALGGTIVSIAYAHFLDPGSDPVPAADGGAA